MTTLVQTLRRSAAIGLPAPGRGARRTLAVAALVAVAASIPGGIEVLLAALGEAYLQVSVFVAGTLALVYGLELAFKADLSAYLLRHQRWQVPIGALLGALPGCGGAIVAVTQFTRGYMSFGGVVATLTATMGDAMFLLLAAEPATGLGVLALGIVVGIASGYVVDAVHGHGFLRVGRSVAESAPGAGHDRWLPARPTAADRLWLVLAVPGAVLGVLGALQLDVDALAGEWMGLGPAFLIGTAGATLALLMWSRRGGDAPERGCADDMCPPHREHRALLRSVIDDTNFVTAWVVFAFAGYELTVHTLGLDLNALFAVWAPIVPLVAVLIGFVPGCGPQIVVTSLYVSGAIPLSAQLGNALANDGDALFPALAVAPRAALLATLYGAVPALVVAYGYLWLWE